MTEYPPRKELGKEKFIATIKKRVMQEGYGFVPLIGSGISHGAGIMIGSALGEYLSYVIWRCVGDYENGGNVGRDGWALVNRGWPDRPSQQQTQAVREWATREYCRLLDQHGLHVGMARNVTLSDINTGAATRYHLPPAKPLAFDEATLNDYKWKNPRKARMALERLLEIDQTIHELHMQQLERGDVDVFTPRKGVSRTSRHYIVETAIRSLYDWRLALHFLARLRQVDGLLLLASECDQYVIDSFNIFITRGRKPCLAHQMIAFLVRPLRIRKLLTTNFDSLLEEAFADLDLPLQVFPIERNSRLPDPNSVALHTSLIKLHGSLHETRADHSLDASPDERDKETFLRYLWPRDHDHPVSVPHHLLVLGTSIPDKRNVELIKYVCDREPDFRVYVIAHDRNTLEAIDRAFGPEYRSHIRFTESNSLDLILYELYQLLTHSLPPAGFKFEFSQYVPPFEDEAPDYAEEMVVYRKTGKPDPDGHSEEVWESRQKFHSVQSFQSALLDQVRAAGEKNQENASSVVILDGRSGITRLGAELFYALKKERKECIWFELEDFSDPAYLLSELFRSISQRLGLYSIENISLEFPASVQACQPGDSGCSDVAGDSTWIESAGWDKGLNRRVQTLIQHFGIYPANWCVFFYGRNVAGSCASYEEAVSAWKRSSADWRKVHFTVLAKIMSELNGAGFRVIYLPYDSSKNEGYEKMSFNALVMGMFESEELRRFVDATDGAELVDDAFRCMGADYVRIDLIKKNALGLEKAVNQVWLNFMMDAQCSREIDRRKRLIYSATLFRQSRHMSALLSEAVFDSRYRYRRYLKSEKPGFASHDHADEVIEWVQRLYQKEFGFFNRKPGGFAWMYHDLRLVVNAMLVSERNTSSNQNLRALRSRIHFWIGEWYLRAFHSSNHVDPLKEAIFHKLMSLHGVKDASYAHQEAGMNAATAKDVDGEDEDVLSLFRYRAALLSSALASIAKIIAVSRESLRYWIPGHQGAGIFYWPAMRKALRLEPDISLNSACTDEELCRLEDYVYRLLGVQRGAVKDKVIKIYVRHVQDVIYNIRRECVKLTYDVQRNAHDSVGDIAKNERNEAVESFVTVRSGVPTDAVDLNVPSGFRPGVEWNSPFSVIANRGGSVLDGLMLDIMSCCTRYRDGSTSDYSSKSNDEDADALVKNIKLIKHKCLYHTAVKSSFLYGFIQLVSEYIFWMIRQAKFENRCLCVQKLNHFEQKDAGGQKRQMKARSVSGDSAIDLAQEKLLRMWGVVGVVSQMLLELLHNLDSTFLFREQRLKIRILTFSGLALGRLGKYLDAHQVLNEATGVAYRISVSDSRREMVILRLRRAEVHLLQAIEEGANFYWEGRNLQQNGGVPAAEVIYRMDAYYRLHIAKLDDAWTVLDEVEALLASCMHSAFWCGKLYYLRLMACSEHYVPAHGDLGLLYRPKAFRELENAGEDLLRNFERGMLCCGEDVYRKLCFLNLFAKACKKMGHFLDRLHPGNELPSKPALAFIEQAVRRVRKVLSGVPENATLQRISWDALFPAVETNDRAARGHGMVCTVADFRDNIIANYDRVFGAVRWGSDASPGGRVP